MKTIFLMYLLIIPVCLQAQIEQYTRVLEPSVLVCQYECVKKVDTLGTDKNCETMILRIGKKISQFYAYLSFYCDSMFNDPTGRRLWGQMMVQAIRSRNYASMPTSKITSNYYYKNYPEGKITTLSYCQQFDKVLPYYWQDFATALANFCHRHGNVLPNLWQCLGKISL